MKTSKQIMNTPNQTDATARPWKLEGNHIMVGPDTIAVCAQGWSDDKANAALIVTTVNEREALLAVEKMAKHLLNNPNFEKLVPATAIDLQQALATLAKIREGK